ncbi:uncharacterized protein LOC120272761 [Dioscorea cayenensis subsp. rotundata]|uniref:Uncharacterized protein LOC120272761 n=1 Tax=Dioscorea cayennensis subsp. rotundata TaxID=55577 RepID=A0AB40C6R2_DIOCR|nr:uncharacterized protein LOC120272761 [Dioscorea cayenensis subsp. rotundata]
MSVPEYQPKFPYPAMVKKDQQDEQFKKFLEMFKTLHINVQFIKALAQMAHYAKYPKELLTKKMKLEEMDTVTLSKECFAIISNTIRKKEKDLGDFTIPCTIGRMIDEKALADLGESINLMSYKNFQKLGLGELKPTKMTLQLANRSVHHPMCIIVDILVKVDRFISLVDFIILDLEDKVEVPLILG